MQRALVAALFTGLAAPAVGTYLVQRRLALMGDGIGHVAVTGVALGLLTGTSPTWTAVVVAILGAVADRGDPRAGPHQRRRRAGAALLRRHRRRCADHRARRAERRPRCSPTSSARSPPSRRGDVWVTIGPRRGRRDRRASACSPQLFAVAQDAEFAQVAGLNVRVYNLLVSVLAAVTVTVAMRTVGLLLVSALMVVPVATAQQLTRTFRTTLGLAMVLGAVAVARRAGAAAFASYQWRVAPGPTIVLLALAGFALTWPIGVLLRRRRSGCARPFDPPTTRWRHDVTEEHAHEHGARLRPPRRPARRPRRLRPRRPPARRAREPL